MLKRRYRVLKSQLSGVIRRAVEAAAENEKEVCGLLVDTGYFLQIIPTRNKIKRGGGSAYYYKEVRSIVSSAEKLGHEVVGAFHSHPFYIAKPGDNDIANAIDDSLLLIIDATEGETALWHIKDNRTRKLEFSLLDDDADG